MENTNWYRVTKRSKELFEEKKSNNLSPQDLVLNEQVETVIKLFEDCHFVGFNPEDTEANQTISSLMSHIQESIDDKILPIANHPFFKFFFGLFFLETILKIIKREYENNLNITLSYIEGVVYNSNDYTNLSEVARNIGRRIINGTLHPDFETIKKHINEQIVYLERTERRSKGIYNELKKSGISNQPKKSIIFNSYETIEKIHSELKGFFLPESETSLLKALHGEQIQYSLTFPHNQNKLVEVFRRLKYNGFILSNDTEIQKWLCSNFSYKKNGEVSEKQLNKHTVWDILNKGIGEAPKKQRICTLDWLPYKSRDQIQLEKEKEKI